MIDTKLLRQKILDLAIRGKLVPQDPNDEPASVLLQKIKEEKTAQVKAGKIKKDKHESVIFRGDDKHYYEQVDGKTTDITAEIPFDIPDGWTWTRLKSICLVSSARRVHKADWKNRGIPFYRAREIAKLATQGFVDNDLFISSEQYRSYKESSGVPLKDDLMVTAVGTIGKTYVVRESDVFYYKDASVICFENRYGINPYYLKNAMYSTILIEQVFANSTGSTVDTITIEKAEEYLFPIPPLSEQQRIVSQIETLLVEVDKIDADATELDNALSLTKQKILDLAIRGKLVPQDPNDKPASELLEKIKTEKEAIVKAGKIKRDKHESFIFRGDDNRYYEQIDGKAADITSEIPFDLPKSWTWTRLGVLTILTMGQSPDGSSVSECANGVEFHQGKLFFSNKILNKSAQYTSEPTRIVPAGSVLVCVRAPVGTVNITHRSICIGRGLAAVTPVILNTEFIYNWLESLKKYLIEQATGSTFVSVSADQVRNLLFPLPPKKEQEHILKIISSTISMLARIE